MEVNNETNENQVITDENQPSTSRNAPNLSQTESTDADNVSNGNERISVLPTSNSIIVIVTSNSTATQSTYDNANNQPTTSRIRPPEYSTIVNMLTTETTRAKYLRTQQFRNPNLEIRFTPPPVAPTIIYAPPPLAGAPPSYSAIMRIGPPEPSNRLERRSNIRIQPSPPFIAPHPPPSYAETQGVYTRLAMLPVEDYIWGTEALTLVCPSCGRMIRTLTHSHRSNLTHFSALILCLCGCWPCCFLPYCMRSCKTTYHYCPNCQTFLGMYTPW